MMTNDLKIKLEHKGTEQELNLAELNQYGDYHVDPERGLIIRVTMYTHSTPDSRHIRGDVVLGTDYEFKPIQVDREAVRERILDEVSVRLTDSELDRIVEEYQRAKVEEAHRFAEMLDGYQILSRADEGVVSTDVEEPLVGWDRIFGDALERACKQTERASRRDLVRKMFEALEESSEGSCEYSARITITGKWTVITDD